MVPRRIGPSAYAITIADREIGFVAKTGTPADDYPWSWYLADDVRPIEGGRATGTTDTRREAMDKVMRNAGVEVPG